MLLDKGNLVKMTFQALKIVDNTKDGKTISQFKTTGKTISVQVNPASYSLSRGIAYQTTQAQGSSGRPQNRTHTSPSTLSFDIIFDGTGVISKESKLDDVPAVGAVTSLFSKKQKFVVKDEITKFEKFVYTVNGAIHDPNKIQVQWGSLQFNCTLDSATYEYSLFDSQGDPLRVKISCRFTEAIVPQAQKAGERNTSADLTHVRELKQGDTLPLMANAVYRDPAMYIEVARVNKLINFRRLTPGKRIIMPPVDKSAKQ